MSDTTTPKLFPVKEFAKRHPFSEYSLRNHIQHARERHCSRGTIPANGLAPALVRIGRRVLIDEAKFFEWLEAQQEPAGAA